MNTEQATVPPSQAFARAEWAAAWLREAKGMAKRAGCEPAVAGSLGRLETLGRVTVNVTIVGAPNVGKSSLINALLQRTLLPTSPLPSQASFAIEPASSADQEKFVVANAARPIAELAGALASARGSPIQVAVSLNDQWLKSSSLRLVEKASLDADEKNLRQAVDNCLRDTDIVVIVVDAQMAMKPAEMEMIRECAGRGMPAIIVLTKLAKLTEEERGVVVQFVEKQARQYLQDIPIVEGDATAVRAAIESLIGETDFADVRFEQFKHALMAALDAIGAAARTGAEAELKSQAERDSETIQRRNQIDAQNMVWMQIEHQLNLRRDKVEEQIRSHLIANQDKTLAFLTYDLDRTNDVKAWWERDMPFRLRHELQAQAAGIAASIDRQLAADRKWLQEELHRQFKYPLALGLEPGLALDEPGVDGRSLPLADAQKLKVVARVGTAAIVIAAGTLFATAGIGGAVVATSLLAGLAAEQWNMHQTSQNREKVRGELNTLVGRGCVSYASDVSAKLKNWYDKVIESVKQVQGQWQQAQIQALQVAKQKADSAAGRTDWADILRQSEALLSKIKPPISKLERE